VAKELNGALGSLSGVEATALQRTSDPLVAVHAGAKLVSAQTRLEDAARRLANLQAPYSLVIIQAKLRANVVSLARGLSPAIDTMRKGLLIIAASIVQELPQPVKIRLELKTILARIRE
jgi:hypothetical protein